MVNNTTPSKPGNTGLAETVRARRLRALLRRWGWRSVRKIGDRAVDAAAAGLVVVLFG